MKKISTISRVVIAVATLAIIATYFLPIWAIYLVAPQYPEGLEMNIWLSKITGQVEIINGLNHYIGMKKINADMFPEFKILPYLIGFFIVYGLAVAATASRKLLASCCILLIVFGIAAMVDFYIWGYDYGHNLDPTAAIQVPGLTYQPPLIGHKQLLNFDAYSYPDTGAWIIIVAAVLSILIWFLEWRRARKAEPTTTSRQAAPSKGITTLAGASILLLIAGCSPKAEKIAYGKDTCTDCKMTIMDQNFGGEIISKKGKVFKFDDAHCMASFLKKGSLKPDEIHQTLFTIYNSGGEKLQNSEGSLFVVSDRFKSPMGSNAAAFEPGAEATKTATETGGKNIDWTTLYADLTK